MASQTPVRTHREGIPPIEIMREFPDDATAATRFIERHRLDGVHCAMFGTRPGSTAAMKPARCPQLRQS